MFDVEKITNEIILWIREQEKKFGTKGFVLGISGGKDSAVCAGLLCKAVGSENVLGVMMPNGEQSDIQDSKKVCEHLGIKNFTININEAYTGLVSQLKNNFDIQNNETLINIPPRLRMTTLFALGREFEYLVCGTGNLSEAYVGYTTKFGDLACDLNPIANLTTDEVVAIGDFLGLPKEITHKTPSDGLSNLSDEQKLGFSYEDLNKYIKTGESADQKTKELIDARHNRSWHKFELPPTFDYKK